MSDEKGAEPFKLQFHYIKGSEYREIACHGVIGGPTPIGKLWISFYSERSPIPRMVEYVVPPPPAGTTSFQFEEAKATPDLIEGRRGVIRNVEFTGYFDVEAAERIYQWLGTQIEQMKSNKQATK